MAPRIMSKVAVCSSYLSVYRSPFSVTSVPDSFNVSFWTFKTHKRKFVYYKSSYSQLNVCTLVSYSVEYHSIRQYKDRFGYKREEQTGLIFPSKGVRETGYLKQCVLFAADLQVR